MYSYSYDVETGGILLNSSPLLFSKEPRPVYYKELDILGLDKYWNYEKNDSYPYMWAEANNYFYRGTSSRVRIILVNEPLETFNLVPTVIFNKVEHTSLV